MIELRVEAEAATVAEARRRALEEMRRQAPSLDASSVFFQVVDEGERGLLGIGARPARVAAFAEIEETPAAAESELAAAVHEYANLVAAGIAEGAYAELSESEEEITVRYSGENLGVLIGRRGQTIQAIEEIANAIAYRHSGSDAKRVKIDAGGYRQRQKAALSYAALRAAKRAIASGEPQLLEPMTAYERRVVHERLKGYPGVRTASEGKGLERRVIVLPSDED